MTKGVEVMRLIAKLAAGVLGAALIELPRHSPHVQEPEGFWQVIKPFLQLAG
jgi:hypothetical protein